MCGIIGFVSSKNGVEMPLKRQRNEALRAIDHRGPDSNGQFIDNRVWLGHVRLSIIDTTEAGNQPMISANGRYIICYNGEVYNYKEIISDFELDDFVSNSDTEVVLKLFEKYQTDSLTSLNGMFAFSIYDKIKRKFWLIRDRLGIKPLYYQFYPHGLLFSSEIKGIISLSEHSSECDVSHLHEWLYFGNTLGSNTLFSGIKQLLPGHFLELDMDKFEFKIEKYWELEKCFHSKVNNNKNVKTIIYETQQLLELAIKRQLVSDVPVGLFLSGGIDSSAICAYASKHYYGRLSTYSVGFDFSGKENELPKAKRVAEFYGTDHHEIFVSGYELGAVVEKMVFHHDMPFSDAANIPLFLLAKQINGNPKVILQGDGGDEVFGGYRRYSTLTYYYLLHKLAKSYKYLITEKISSILGQRLLRYVNAFSENDLSQTMARLLTLNDPQLKPWKIFSPNFASKMQSYSPFVRFEECSRNINTKDIRNIMTYIDLLIQLPDIYLEKVDRSTMAASVEVRVPFLDYNLVDYVMTLESKIKVPFGKKKWLLKKVLNGIVPKDILDQPKSGFNVPYSFWLTTSLRTLFMDHLLTFKDKNHNVLDCCNIERIYSELTTKDYQSSFLLWKVLNFIIWSNINNIKFK